MKHLAKRIASYTIKAKRTLQPSKVAKVENEIKKCNHSKGLYNTGQHERGKRLASLRHAKSNCLRHILKNDIRPPSHQITATGPYITALDRIASAMTTKRLQNQEPYLGPAMKVSATLHVLRLNIELQKCARIQLQAKQSADLEWKQQPLGGEWLTHS